jgi:hypothetical protein
MKRSDITYYVGYLSLFIMLGVWMLLLAMDILSFGEAFLMWLLSAGILLVVIGAVNRSRGASNMQLAAGLVLAVFVLIMLAVSSDILGGFVGAALGIILIGVIGLALLFRNIRLEA